MQEEIKNPDALSPEIQEVMRSLISAIRAVKLYPSNNPVYTQSVKKSYEALAHFLKTTPEYNVGVQKTFFTYGLNPVGKETQVNKPIAQDLFAKGIRTIVFNDGVTEEELLVLLQSLALSAEELAMKSGISSILWEKDATHIKITESGLDDVVRAKTEGGADARLRDSALQYSSTRQDILSSDRTLVLGELMTNPTGFGSGMLDLAQQTRSEHESVEDRLFTLYQEAGRRIREQYPEQVDAMFDGLAQSALDLESPARERLVSGKLYGNMDSETTNEQQAVLHEQIPSEFHEILTGRFSNAWTVKQIATLLKKSSTKKIEPATPLSSPQDIEAVPIPQDLSEIARRMAEYAPEEMEKIKAMGESGMESDIIEAAVRTLIFLLTLVKNPYHVVSEEKEMSIFSGVVHQLEDILSYLLKQRDYDLAAIIIRTFHTMPVYPEFRPRMAEAIKKTTAKSTIAAIITDLRKSPKGSPEYVSAYSYLTNIEREATEVLLQLLADETDRTVRGFLLEIVKEIGKNQILLLGEHLTDARWYFVRNVVSILGRSEADQALAFLQKVADHKDARIRQEVVKGLIAIGGKNAARLLANFLNDRDTDIQIMAIRGFSELKDIGSGETRLLTGFLLDPQTKKKNQELTLEVIKTLGKIGGPEETKSLMVFLQERQLKKKEQECTLEAIKVLSKVGGADAREFLQRYTRIRWWKPQKLQRELCAAAQRAMKEITRRQSDGGRAGR